MSAPIRAVLLTGPLEVTAANLRILDLTREFLRREIEVTVVCGPGELETRFEAAEVPLVISELTGRFIEDLPRDRTGAVSPWVGRGPLLRHSVPALSRLGTTPWDLRPLRPVAGDPRPRQEHP